MKEGCFFSSEISAKRWCFSHLGTSMVYASVGSRVVCVCVCVCGGGGGGGGGGGVLYNRDIFAFGVDSSHAIIVSLETPVTCWLKMRKLEKCVVIGHPGWPETIWLLNNASRERTIHQKKKIGLEWCERTGPYQPLIRLLPLRSTRRVVKKNRRKSRDSLFVKC